jgi:phosphatidate phosphatase LPIN
MTASLPKNRRLEGNSIDGNDMHAGWSGNAPQSDQDKQDSDDGFDPKTVRSQSVPPDLEGSPTASRHELPKAGIYHYSSGGHFMAHGAIQDQFGAGGKLSARKTEPALFVVAIEGQKVSFELSLIEDDTDGSPASQETELARSSIQQDGKRRLVKRSEVETAQLFERGKVAYTRFIEDENILKDERLVIRWANDQ